MLISVIAEKSEKCCSKVEVPKSPFSITCGDLSNEAYICYWPLSSVLTPNSTIYFRGFSRESLELRNYV